MHLLNALTLRNRIAQLSAIFVALTLALLLNGCGGSNSSAGNQNDHRPPVASLSAIGLVSDANQHYTVRAKKSVLLSGKDSRGTDSPILTYQWEQISGANVTLNARTADSVTFEAPNLATAAELTFKLTVVDANQHSDSATLTIGVQPSDDLDQFLTGGSVTSNKFNLVAALQGGTSTGSTAQTFSITAVTIAHWRNKLGVMDQRPVFSETQTGVFPANFNPAADYLPLAENLNPTLQFELRPLSIDDINQAFLTSELTRRLEPSNIGTAYLDIQINVTTTGGANFEIFAVDSAGALITAPSILAADPTNISTPNGSLLQTWNSGISALLSASNLQNALGLESTISASNYYLLLDPSGQFARLTDWLAYAGLSDTHTEPTSDPNKANALYFNNYELGYGRNIWMNKTSTGNVFSYITNYPSVEAALQCQQDFSVFAMEYSDNPDPQGTNAKIVKFYAYVPDPLTGNYVRTNTIDIDGRGQKPVPGVCLGCHQGQVSDRQFATAAAADLDATFIPLDLDAYLFAQAQNPALVEPSLKASNFAADELTKHSRETQEAEFKKLNLGVLATYADNPDRHLAAIELIHGWYGDTTDSTQGFKPSAGPAQKPSLGVSLPVAELPSSAYNGSYVQAGWVGQEDLYNKVYSRYCRSCHTQMASSFNNFESYSNFINNENLVTQVFELGAMPYSRHTMDRFWVPFYGGESAASILRQHLASLGQTVTQNPGTPIPQFSASNYFPSINQSVKLDASNSRFAASYSWSLSAPSNSSATLTNSTGPITSFTPDVSSGSFAVSLTITNTKGEQATSTQTIGSLDLAPVAMCFTASTSAISNSGNLANIPLLANINNQGDGSASIETLSDGSLGVVVDNGDGSFNYQLNDPFVRGVDSILYRLADIDGSLSLTDSGCPSNTPAGFGVITLDTTLSGTSAPDLFMALPDPQNDTSVINLSWAAPTGVQVDGYNVYQNATATGSPLNTSLITGTSFSDAGLTPGTDYEYAVVAVIGSFTSNPALAAAATLPLTPTALNANGVGTNQINLFWTAPPGNLQGYAIYRDGVPVPLDTVPATQTTYADLSVAGGSQYTYAVTAFTSSGESSPSNFVVGTSFPDSPTGFTGAATSDADIDLSWDPVACSSPTSYLLTPPIGSPIPLSTTSYTISNLSGNTGYSFDLQAVCNSVNSSVVNSGLITTLSTVPTNLSAISPSPNQVDLTWTEPFTAVDFYQIYRDDLGSSPIATVGAPANSYSDTSAYDGTVFTYTVTAVTAGVESAPTNGATVATPPFPPSGLNGSALSDTEIEISFGEYFCSTTPSFLLTPSGLSEIVVTTEPYVVTGLTPLTDYTFTAKMVCNGAISDPTAPTATITTGSGG